LTGYHPHHCTTSKYGQLKNEGNGEKVVGWGVRFFVLIGIRKCGLRDVELRRISDLRKCVSENCHNCYFLNSE